MPHVYQIPYYVYGRDVYADITPTPDTALGYFANSLIPSLDTAFPKGELRLMKPALTEAQQAPQTGSDFSTVNMDINFET